MRKIRGFTLIELLVVVAIIALIGGFFILSINSSRAKARDTKRISDLQSIQVALELYRSSHGQYPETRQGGGNAWINSNNTNSGGCDGSSINNWDTVGSTTSLSSKIGQYMQSLPHDPLEGRQYTDDGPKTYWYVYGGTKTDYKLKVHLEINDSLMTTDGGCYPSGGDADCGSTGHNQYEIYTPGAKYWFSSPTHPMH